MRFKVGLDKNLDDLLASVNFDRYLYGLVVTCAPKATLRNVGYFKALCLHQSGTDGSNPVPSSRESVSLGISPLHDESEAALGVTAPPSILAHAAEVNE